MSNEELYKRALERISKLCVERDVTVSAVQQISNIRYYIAGVLGEVEIEEKK